MKQTSSSRFYWLPPKKAGSFFLAASDDTFRLRHPFAYPLVVALGLAALLLPCVVFGVCAPLVAPQGEWLAIGYLWALACSTSSAPFSGSIWGMWSRWARVPLGWR